MSGMRWGAVLPQGQFLRGSAIAHQENLLEAREQGPQPFEPLIVGLNAFDRTVEPRAVALRRHRGDTHRLNLLQTRRPAVRPPEPPILSNSLLSNARRQTRQFRDKVTL